MTEQIKSTRSTEEHSDAFTAGYEYANACDLTKLETKGGDSQTMKPECCDEHSYSELFFRNLVIPNVKVVLAHGFEPFTITSKAIFDEYSEKTDGLLSSCTTFASIIGWAHSIPPYFKVIENALCLVLFQSNKNTWMAFPPLCRYSDVPLASVLEKLTELFEALNLPLHFYHVKEWMLGYFRSLGAFNFSIKYNESESDYIYTAEAFAKYLEKSDIRYNLRRVRKMIQPSVEPLSAENINDLLTFFKENWCRNYSCNACIVVGCMYKAINVMVNHADELGLHIFLVYSSRKCVGYAGYMVRNEELTVLTKGLKRSIKGLTDYIHEVIIRSVKENYSTINYTEDMGKVGLRRYKQNLAPYTLSHNYELTFVRQGFET